MRILHLFHNADLFNGVDRLSLTLVRELHRMGHQVYALVPENGEVVAALRALGIPYRISYLGCCTSVAKMAEFAYLSRLHSRSEEISGWIREAGIELVHINTGHLLDGALAAARSGIPSLWHIHSPFAIDFQRYRDFLTPAAYSWILRSLGTRTIAVSEGIKASLSEWVPEDHITTLYNGVDLDPVGSPEPGLAPRIRQELGLDQTSPLVLGVGRICAQKDFGTFVRVAQKVVERNRKVYFAIAGPTEDRNLTSELHQLIDSLCLRSHIFVLGARNDVPDLLRESAIFLSTSIYEGHPLTTLEALSNGTPVVAMDCLGLRECIRHGIDGILIPAGDIDACAEAILTLLDSPEKGRALTQEGRKTVATRYSAECFAKNFMEIAQTTRDRFRHHDQSAAAECLIGLLSEIGALHHRLVNSQNQRSSSRLKNKLMTLLKSS